MAHPHLPGNELGSFPEKGDYNQQERSQTNFVLHSFCFHSYLQDQQLREINGAFDLSSLTNPCSCQQQGEGNSCEQGGHWPGGAGWGQHELGAGHRSSFCQCPPAPCQSPGSPGCLWHCVGAPDPPVPPWGSSACEAGTSSSQVGLF